MKNWSVTLLGIFLCTALFTGYAVKAQASKSVTEQEVPAKFRGNWALPDCGSEEEGLIITRHYYLRSDKEGSHFWPIAARKLKDYWVVSIEGEKHPAMVTADGVLKIGLPEKIPAKWPAHWDNISMDGHREYMGCVEIPAILPDALVRVMQHIDDVAAACHSSLSSACTKLLFTIADENKNRKISVQEMKDAARMLASIAALAESHTVTRDAMDKAVYQALRETDAIAAKVDPGGREMTYDDFRGFLAKTDSALLRETLKSVSPIAPGLRN